MRSRRMLATLKPSPRAITMKATTDRTWGGEAKQTECDAFVLFGDRVPTDPGAWRPGDPHYDDLTAGDGRLLAEQIAEQLGAVIVPI